MLGALYRFYFLVLDTYITHFPKDSPKKKKSRDDIKTRQKGNTIPLTLWLDNI